VEGVAIHDPLCVGKTFPGYWTSLGDAAGWTPDWFLD
jgi:5-enolpyruvylshikimate-3-phosphate synthase